MKTTKKCPRCDTPMTWNESSSKPPFNLGTFECWKCNKIIQGLQVGDKEPITWEEYQELKVKY